MQLVQTAAEPPNQGRICLAMRGWTWNRRKALRTMVMPKRMAGTRGLAAGGASCRPAANDARGDGVGSFIGNACWWLARCIIRILARGVVVLIMAGAIPITTRI